MIETIRKITLRRLRMPLHVPYRLSYRTFDETDRLSCPKLEEPIHAP